MTITMTTTQSDSVTLQFFYQCLRAFVHQKPIPSSPQHLDNDALYRLIVKHQVKLLFLSLITQQVAHQTLHKTLRPQATRLTHRYLKASQHLIEVIQLFHTAHIDYIVLKGIPLNIQLYGTACLRDIRDIDILISREKLTITHQQLTELGYQLKGKITPIHLHHEYAFLLKYTNEINYWHPIKKICIDLKWQTSAHNYYGMQWVNTHNTRVITIKSLPFLVLSHEHNFFYLCIHAAQHGWEHLKWLIDLAVFYRTIPFCWNTVVSLARQTHALRPLLELQILLQELFDINTAPIVHSKWDMLVVKARLHAIKAQWPKGLWRDNQTSNHLYQWLGSVLYPKPVQKYHYLCRLLLLRTKSLATMGQLKKPTVYKMLLKSIL